MRPDRIMDHETGDHVANIVDGKVLSVPDDRHIANIKDGNIITLAGVLVGHISHIDSADRSPMSDALRQLLKANDA